MFLNIHTHSIKNIGIEIINISLEEITKNLFSIGIHPCFVDLQQIDNQLKIIEQNLQHKNCVALGEIGLDKLCSVDFSQQIHILERQIELAAQYQKPVIIHCVKSFQEIIELFKKHKFSYPKIIHGFNKNQQTANQLLANDFFLSFGKTLLYNESLQMVFQNTDLEKIFLETDNSNLSVITIYQKAAELKNISLEQLQKSILKNAISAKFHF